MQKNMMERRGSFVSKKVVEKNNEFKTNTEIREAIESKNKFLFIKRIQDLLLAFIAFVVLLPLLILIGLIVFIDDPKGSPIFSQDRVGKDGRIFKFFKFRTMCVDAEDKINDLFELNESEGPVFKIKPVEIL